MNKQQNISTRLIRQSNMELLRIVAMSMIIIGHFMVHAIYNDNPNSTIYRFLLPFFICGVNLFFLLSGYFKIKLTLLSLVKLIVLVVCFELISNVLYIEMGGGISISAWIELIVFPITKSPYWFIKAYLGLMLISPIINRGLESLPIEKLRLVIILFSIFTLYSCGLGHNLCNNNGYTFGQGIYLYCLAHWLRAEHQIFSKVHTWIYLVVAIGLTLVSSVMFTKTGLLSLSAYNSVLTVSVSVSIFLFFCNLKVKNNRIINRVASAALGCYLLQDGILGGKLYEWQHDYFVNTESYTVLIILFSVCFIVFWILSFVITGVANKISLRIIAAMPQKWNNDFI